MIRAHVYLPGQWFVPHGRGLWILLYFLFLWTAIISPGLFLWRGWLLPVLESKTIFSMIWLAEGGEIPTSKCQTLASSISIFTSAISRRRMCPSLPLLLVRGWEPCGSELPQQTTPPTQLSHPTEPNQDYPIHKPEKNECLFLYITEILWLVVIQ